MDNKLSRRDFLRGLAAGGAAVALAGCGTAPTPGPTSSPPTKAPSAPTSSAPQPTAIATAGSQFNWKRFSGARIRFLNNTHDFTTAIVPKILPEFEQLTGIKVVWEVLPENQFRQKLTLELQANPETVDGYQSLTSWDGEAFWQKGWYEPIKKYLDSPELTNPDFDFKDIFPNTVKIATVHDTLVGVPCYPDVQLLYYNKEILQKNGVKAPETVQEFVAAAEKLNDKNANIAGYVSRGDGIQAVYTFAPFLFGAGGRWLDEKGRPDVDTEAFANALDIYAGTLRKYGPPGFLGMQFPQAQVVFAQGNGAMYSDSCLHVSMFEDPTRSKIVGKVGYTMLPKGKTDVRTTLISWCMSICSQSKNKEAAWYLTQWLLGKDVVKRMGQAKIPVPRESVWNSPEYQSGMPKEYLDSFVKAIPLGVVNQANPLVVQVPETRDAIGKAITSVLQGGSSKEAAAKCQQDLLKALGMS